MFSSVVVFMSWYQSSAFFFFNSHYSAIVYIQLKPQLDKSSTYYADYAKPRFAQY